ncbi:MAG: YdjY domain-containing protein [Ignavibacteriaceae bacterium]|nr:YdjY domain-containing protein [Ignavibacteriaceae bacterium]
MRYLIVFCFLFSLIVFPQINSDGKEEIVTKLSDSLYQIGNVTLNTRTNEILMPGKINMDKGVIELLACAPGGKVHESVLVIDVIPYHLQVALLLLGLNYGEGAMHQSDTSIPNGDSVAVFVKWVDNDNNTLLYRGEQLVFNLRDSSVMQKTNWVFTGSKIIDGLFVADVEKSLITTFHDPFTILDNPSPDGAFDDFFIVNEKIVPPKGTTVEVIIKSGKL